MKKTIIFLFALVMLTSCSTFKMHITPVEQGNVLRQEQLTKLHRGMSESAVKSILGKPILINTFSLNRLDYVYSLKSGYSPLVEKRVLCTFSNGRLINIQQEFINSH